LLYPKEERLKIMKGIRVWGWWGRERERYEGCDCVVVVCRERRKVGKIIDNESNSKTDLSLRAAKPHKLMCSCKGRDSERERWLAASTW
jgi:hypothetical protein